MTYVSWGPFSYAFIVLRQLFYRLLCFLYSYVKCQSLQTYRLYILLSEFK